MAEERTAKDIIMDCTLNDYERAVFRGYAPTRGAKAVKSKAISEAVAGVLNGTIVQDGEEMSIAEMVVVKVVAEIIANPSTSKLKDLASIVGDVGAAKVEILTSQVDEDLARAAIGEDIDGEE